jgi:hypothetical protein
MGDYLLRCGRIPEVDAEAVGHASFQKVEMAGKSVEEMWGFGPGY